MPPIPLTVTTGMPSGPLSSNYVDLLSKDNLQQINNTKIQQGHSANRGVILTQDGLNVPLETAFGIHDEKSESSRPTLSPLFRTRYVDQPNQGDDGSDYAELRNSLPPELQELLTEDEKLPFRDRDPNMIALDNSLQFEANRRGLVKSLANPPIDIKRATADAANFKNLPAEAKHNIAHYSGQIVQGLDNYLQTIGPNDPSYDLLLNASNQMKEGIDLL